MSQYLNWYRSSTSTATSPVPEVIFSQYLNWYYLLYSPGVGHDA